MHLSFVQDLSATIAALSAAYGVFRGMPLLADRLKLIRERDGAQESSREAREAAEAYRLSSEGWQSAVDRLRDQVSDLTVEVHTLRSQLAAAILYITEVQAYQRGGNVGLPPKLPTALYAALAALSREEAP